MSATNQVAPRKKGVFAKIAAPFQNFRSGKATQMAALGPFGGASASETPGNTNHLVQMPRVSGDGRVKIPGASAEAIVAEVEAAAENIGLERAAEQPEGGLAKVKWVFQQAASLLALHPGPKHEAADVVNLYIPTGASASGRDTNETPMLTVALDHLAAVAAGEKAKAALDLAAQVELPAGVSLELDDVAGRIQAERTAVRQKAHESAAAFNGVILEGLVQTVPATLQARVKAAAETLFSRLGAATVVPATLPAGAPDVMSAQVLSEAAKTAFGDNHEALTEALEALQDMPRATLGERISQVASGTEGIQADGRLDDPALQLVATLSRVPGGQSMLAKLMPAPADMAAGAKAAHAEALRVSASTLSALQMARRQGEVDPQQKAWLSRAAAHASGVLGNPADPAMSKAERRRRHTAFRGVQSGFASNGPGSSYASVNSRLGDFSTGGMDQTQRRNQRAARSRFGRIKNWATGGLPKTLEGWSGLIPAAVNAVGTQPTVWRKSVMRQLTKSAVANRMLPSRNEALSGLNRATADMRQGLLDRDGGTTPAEVLMLKVIDALHLGTDQPVNERSLKKLDSAFFTRVETGLPGGVEGLGPELAAAWNALRGTRPNAGHVLTLLSAHIDIRSVLDGAPVDAQQVDMSQVARGARSDRLGHQAVAAFAELAPALRAVTETLRAVAEHPGEIVPEEEAPDELASVESIAALVAATADALAAVKPPAALGALRTDTYEAIEISLARKVRDAAPADARPTWDEARELVKDSWPDAVKTAWNEMKHSGDDASRLMRMLIDETIPLMPTQPAGPATQEAAAAGVPTMRDAIIRATAPLQALQSDVHANRFELAVADTVTLFNDLRSERDAKAVMTSLSQRVSLGEKFKSADSRQGNVDIGKAITLAMSFQEIVSPMLGGGIGDERSMDLNMNGAAMQLWIGKTSTTNVSIGLTAGLRGDLGNDDHEFNIGEDGEEAGVALRFNLRAELGGEWSSTEGVSLRLERTGGHEDQLRRAFGDVLADLSNPQLDVDDGDDGDNEPYPDVLASLLDRHPALAVADLSNEKRARTSELGAMANAMVRVKGAVDVPEDERKGRRRAIGVGASAGGALKTQRGSSDQTESQGRLTVEEHKVTQTHRGDLRAGLLTPVAILPGDKQQPEFNPQVRGTQLEARKQIYNSGVDKTMRLVERNGETWADQTQMIREYENVDDFLTDLEPLQHQYVALLATKDNVPDLSAAEKAGRAWERLNDTLQQAKAGAATSAGSNMTHSLVTKLRPEAAQVFDGLEALALLADEAGRPEDASRHRADIAALLKSDDAWVANNLQFKTKAKGDASQTATLGFGQGKAAGESTRLHEFVPATAGGVGKSADKPIAVPQDHSGRWVPNLPPLEPTVEPRLPPKPGSLAELLQRPHTPDRVESDLYPPQTPEQTAALEALDRMERQRQAGDLFPPTPAERAAAAALERMERQPEAGDLYPPTSEEPAASAAFEAAGQQHETGDLYPPTPAERAAAAALERMERQREAGHLYPPTSEEPAASAAFDAAGQQHETGDLYPPTPAERAAAAALERMERQPEAGDLYPPTAEELAASAAFEAARPPLSSLIQSLDAQVQADQAAMLARLPADIPRVEPIVVPGGLPPEEADLIPMAEPYMEPSITRADRS
jgi:hypothetical protein